MPTGSFALSILTVALMLPGIAAANSKLRRMPPPKSDQAPEAASSEHGGGHKKSSSPSKATSAEKLTYAAPEGWQEVPPQKGYLKTFSKLVDDPEVYKASIQVRRQQGPHPIDGIFLDEMKEYLVHKIQGSGSPMAKYEVRSGELMTLPSGRKAILIYADFYLDTEAMMHLHFIVSSADNHYFFTYTDTKSEMENPGVGTTASQVFDSFVAVDLPSMAPGRFQWPLRIGVGLFAFVALVLVLQRIKGRKYAQNSNHDEYGDHSAEAADEASVVASTGSEAEEYPQLSLDSDDAPAPKLKKKRLMPRLSLGKKKARSLEDELGDMGDDDEGFSSAGQQLATEEPFALAADDFEDEGEDNWNLADTEKTKIS